MEDYKNYGKANVKIIVMGSCAVLALGYTNNFVFIPPLQRLLYINYIHMGETREEGMGTLAIFTSFKIGAQPPDKRTVSVSSQIQKLDLLYVSSSKIRHV